MGEERGMRLEGFREVGGAKSEEGGRRGQIGRLEVGRVNERRDKGEGRLMKEGGGGREAER